MENSWKDTVVAVSRPIRYAVAAMLVVLTLFLLVMTIDGLHNWGHEDNNGPSTITVTGEGMATAIPDTATVSFTATATAADVATAESKMTTMTSAALAAVKAQGVTSDDITTTSYNVSPHYNATVCPPGVMCPGAGSTSGYDVSESVDVKIHDTTKVAGVLAGLATAGITNVSGPDFVVADTQTVMQQARAQAISKAQADAQKLVGQLGVHLGKITDFEDNTGNSQTLAPTYKAAATDSAMGAAAPAISTGTNSYTDDVSITYEIN